MRSALAEDLARAARRAGAKRFVFLSSIRAQCGPTADTVLTEAVEPGPTDAYGRSKLAAERGLAELLGGLLVSQFAQAAERRAMIAEHDRKDFTLYIDEFQNFASQSFERILS